MSYKMAIFARTRTPAKPLLIIKQIISECLSVYIHFPMLILHGKFSLSFSAMVFFLVFSALRSNDHGWPGLMVDMACANGWRSFSINKVKVSGSSNDVNTAYYTLAHTHTRAGWLGEIIKVERQTNINRAPVSCMVDHKLSACKRTMVIKVRITHTKAIFIDLPRENGEKEGGQIKRINHEWLTNILGIQILRNGKWRRQCRWGRR